MEIILVITVLWILIGIKIQVFTFEDSTILLSVMIFFWTLPTILGEAGLMMSIFLSIVIGIWLTKKVFQQIRKDFQLLTKIFTK